MTYAEKLERGGAQPLTCEVLSAVDNAALRTTIWAVVDIVPRTNHFLVLIVRM